MSDSPDNNSSDRRRQRNSDLIRRMRNGEQLNAIDSKASWYPPRPVIKKDQDEMARLYNGVERRASPRDAVESRRVVRLANLTLEPATNASATSGSEAKDSGNPVGDVG